MSEQPFDTNNDGIPDSVVLDSNSDGTPDSILMEDPTTGQVVVGTDTDSDGNVDIWTDEQGNPLPDNPESQSSSSDDLADPPDSSDVPTDAAPVDVDPSSTASPLAELTPEQRGTYEGQFWQQQTENGYCAPTIGRDRGLGTGREPGRCAIPTTNPGWGDQFYTQIAENPTQPVVWTNNAPDPGWTSLDDVAADPHTFITGPGDTTTDQTTVTGADLTGSGGPTVFVGGPQDTPSTDPVPDPGTPPPTEAIGQPQNSPSADPTPDPSTPNTTVIIGGPGTRPGSYDTNISTSTGGFTAVIGGPQSSDTLTGVFTSMLDTAISRGDVQSQVAIQNILDSQEIINGAWTS